ncbi:MAG: O-antigen ligase family protein [Candidatus Magasanikbacteria bacterium]|nr:O-antigen ligase family protein [Candidatus Magasanikbacteria bacterium]
MLIWFPLENLILRYTPIEYYAPVKYFPEVLIYSALLVGWYRYAKRAQRFFLRLPLNKWFLAFIAAAVVSLALNWYNLAIWFLGLRQILRFSFIFIIVLFEDYPDTVIRRFLWLGAGMVLFEAALGLIQYLSGGALDRYLFFSDSVSIAGVAELEGLQQFWAPGERVFATLGRYDRLGSLLALGLTMIFPWLYVLKKERHQLWWCGAMLVGGVALILTYSRSSWIAAVVGIVTIGYGLVRDKRILKLATVLGGVLAAYLLFIVVTNNYGGGALDKPSQTFPERIIEAVSVYSWRQNYEGYGRFFFIVNTPLMVVRYYPLFGVGSGNYGGGVAAALGNTKVYDTLHLPFGIQNTFGQIDNNWLSLWGEIGTVGLLCWIMILVTIFKTARIVSVRSPTVTERTVAQGLCGVVVGVMIMAYFGPFFEFRSLMLYFWLLVGIVMRFYRSGQTNWNFLKE